MEPDDVPAAVGAWTAAIGDLHERSGEPSRPFTPADRERIERRMHHFRTLDPGGSWVAETAGRVTGLAQSSLRDGHWMLSLLGVVPDAQGTGAGRDLFHAALTLGDGGASGSIQASLDPRAVVLYASAGFQTHPAMAAHGVVARRPDWPDAIRRGDPDDLAHAARIDTDLRGVTRTVDLEFLLSQPGQRLLVDDDGYAIAMDDRIVTLAARRAESAARLLRAALHDSPQGTEFEVAWLTGSHQWAVPVALEARLSLTGRGTVMTRPGAPLPTYIPSGGYG